MTIDIREKERSVLEMAAYVQSINIALTPVIPTIAVIVTFLVHIGLGYDLSPAEVCRSTDELDFTFFSLHHLQFFYCFHLQGFAVVAVMIGRVRPWLSVARDALRSWDEANVCWPRIEVGYGIILVPIEHFRSKHRFEVSRFEPLMASRSEILLNFCEFS